jgi:exopolysaccharide production protein ExoQ
MLQWWYYIAAGFFLLSTTGAPGFVDRMMYGAWPGKQGDKVTETLNLLTIAVSLLLFCGWGARRLPRPRFNRVLPLAAAGLFVASALWSVDPGVTLSRSVAYFFVVVGAIGTVEILDSDEVMRLTALIGGFSAVASLLVFFVLPDTAILEFGGFRGIFSQKNPLGQAMVVGVLAGLHGVRIGGRRRFSSIGITMLCTIVAFMSKSATSLFAIVAFLIFHIIGSLYVRGGGRRLFSFWLTIVGGLFLFLLMKHIDLIFSYFEKDPTLTGRTDLWPYVIDAVLEQPMLGWGLTAFWSPLNPRAAEVSSMVGWGFSVPEAHNGLLELLLDVGIVGTAFFLFLWLRNLVMAVKCMNGPAAGIGVSSLLFLIGVLLIGVSEQVLVTAEGPTAQFFLLGFMCEKELWLARRARSASPSDPPPSLWPVPAPREESVA